MAEPKAARPVSKSSSSLADSSKATDFVEIFGGLEASCSIPFLELPVGFEDSDDARGGERRFVEDYQEIFGGFGGLNLGISCEEMQRPYDLDGRLTKEISLGMQEVEDSKLSSQWPNQIFSDLAPLKDKLKQFSRSHKKSGWKNIEETTSGEMGFSHGTNACSSQNSERNSTSGMDANDVSTHGDSNSTRASSKQETPAFKGVKDSVNNMNDLEQLSTSVPTSEDDCINLNSYPCSSSSHSTPGRGISCPEVPYVTVSDISLQTQPLLVSPPSKPPPEVAYKNSPPKIKIFANMKDDEGEGGLYQQSNRSQQRWKAFSKRDALQNSLRDGSPCFYDADDDPGSAAAAAVADAAMKEAMEQARVRLKIAKMSMDRKRHSFKAHKDLVKVDNLNSKDEGAEAAKASSEDMTQIITMAIEDEEMNGSTPLVRQKHMRTAKVASNHEEKESQVAGEEDVLQRKKTKSSRSKLEEKSGELKIESQCCELINNDKMVGMVLQVPGQENVEKEMRSKEDKGEQDTKVVKIPTELKKMRKLWAVGEPHEVKNKLKLKANTVAIREEEIKEIITAIREAHAQDANLNMPERTYDSSLEDETEGKPEETFMYGNHEKNLENFDHYSSYEKFHKSEENNTNSKTFKKGDQCKVSETKSCIACEPQESERVRKLTYKTSVNTRRNLKSRTDHVNQKPWRN
ncbi:hypothetical protein IHE45_04G075000 [Dioscorea alata]|uniref:Uncharacterized protein n=1 Tax=Dioscorea alata TaxID=55571 RepID=A0ACB7WDX3_DIOAL|nr:hypothetical protein IHE45_04G075000 [Dioscorea alata]